MAIDKSALDLASSSLHADTLNYIRGSINKLIQATGDALPNGTAGEQLITAVARSGKSLTVYTDTVASNANNIVLKTMRIAFKDKEIIEVLVPNNPSTANTNINILGVSKPLVDGAGVPIPYNIISNKLIVVEISTATIKLLETSTSLSASSNYADPDTTFENKSTFVDGAFSAKPSLNVHASITASSDGSVEFIGTNATAYTLMFLVYIITTKGNIAIQYKITVDTSATTQSIIETVSLGANEKTSLQVSDMTSTFRPTAKVLYFTLPNAKTIKDIYVTNVYYKGIDITSIVVDKLTTTPLASNPHYSLVNDNDNAYALHRDIRPLKVDTKEAYLDITNIGTVLDKNDNHRRYLNIVINSVEYFVYAFHSSNNASNFALLLDIAGNVYIYNYAANQPILLNADLTATLLKLKGVVPATRNTITKLKNIVDALNIPSMAPSSDYLTNTNSAKDTLKVPNSNPSADANTIAVNKATAESSYAVSNPPQVFLDVAASADIGTYKGNTYKAYNNESIGADATVLGSCYSSTNISTRDITSSTSYGLYKKKNSDETNYKGYLASTILSNGKVDTYCSFSTPAYTNELTSMTTLNLNPATTQGNTEGDVTYKRNNRRPKVHECIKDGYLPKEHDKGDNTAIVISDTTESSVKQAICTRDGLLILLWSGKVYRVIAEIGNTEYVGVVETTGVTNLNVNLSFGNSDILSIGTLIRELHNLGDKVFAVGYNGDVYGIGKDTSGSLGVGTTNTIVSGFDAAITGASEALYSFTTYGTACSVMAKYIPSTDTTHYYTTGLGTTLGFTNTDRFEPAGDKPGRWGVYRVTTSSTNTIITYNSSAQTLSWDSSPSAWASVPPGNRKLYQSPDGTECIIKGGTLYPLGDHNMFKGCGGNYLSAGRNFRTDLDILAPNGYNMQLPSIDRFITPSADRVDTTVVKGKDGDYFYMDFYGYSFPDVPKNNWTKIILPNGANIISVDVGFRHTINTLTTPTTRPTILTILDDRNNIWLMGSTNKFGMSAGCTPMKVVNKITTLPKPSSYPL